MSMKRSAFRWNKWTVSIVLLLALVWGVDSSWKFNTESRMNSWESVMWADASGYYMYLPGLFTYHFRASEVDPALPDSAGHGFSLDTDADRVVIKYFYGTAVLQLPFYLVAELYEGWGTTDGFTLSHIRAIEAAGIFYWIFGLLLLGLALQREIPAAAWVAPVTLGAISFGTNVFYYALRQPAYSHIYSFFLVCLAIWCLVTGLKTMKSGWRLYVFHFACALIILARPVNGLAVGALYAWLWAVRPEAVRQFRFWAVAAITFLLVLAPQLMYWHFVHGDWIVYSYQNEGFVYWARPKLLQVLFSPECGLIVHAPAMALLPVGLWTLRKSRKYLNYIIVGVLALAVYSCAAWHSPHFGCSYGLRPLVEYMPFLAIPIWAFLAHPGEKALNWRCALLPLLVLFSFINYRIMLEFSSCYVWGTWNWSEYVIDFTDAFFGHLGPDKK